MDRHENEAQERIRLRANAEERLRSLEGAVREHARWLADTGIPKASDRERAAVISAAIDFLERTRQANAVRTGREQRTRRLRWQIGLILTALTVLIAAISVTATVLSTHVFSPAPTTIYLPTSPSPSPGGR